MLLLKLYIGIIILGRTEGKRKEGQGSISYLEKMWSQANEKGNWGLGPKGSFKKTDTLKRERKKTPDLLG